MTNKDLLELIARTLAETAMEPFDELSQGKYAGDASAVLTALGNAGYVISHSPSDNAR